MTEEFFWIWIKKKKKDPNHKDRWSGNDLIEFANDYHRWKVENFKPHLTKLRNIATNQKDIDPNIHEIINEKFWDLL